MANTAEQSPETPYDIAVARFRVYNANKGQDFKKREEALNAIPGYSEALTEAFAQAHSRGGGLQEVTPLIPFESQMAEIDQKFSHLEAPRQAERNAVIAAFGVLDESDVRRLFDLPEWPRDEQTITFPMITQMLMLSRNPNAVTPFIERLQAEVKDNRQTTGNRFFNYVADFLNRDLVRSARQAHRALDRSLTIRALGRLGDRRAEPAIRPFLQDADEGVRKAAQKALALLATYSVKD